MADEKTPIKLFTWRQGIILGIAACGGVALATYRSYIRKGHIDKVDMAAMITALLICISVGVWVAWWENRPEKED